jgi:hypothetical protein
LKGGENMKENINMTEVVEEIRGADEDQLKEVISRWFEETRTAGLKIGASFISAAVYSAIQKHLVKKEKSSLRDYKRCIDDIIKIVSRQLQTQQNDYKEVDSNDGTTEDAGGTDFSNNKE